jgi:hypothetical protein
MRGRRDAVEGTQPLPVSLTRSRPARSPCAASTAPIASPWYISSTFHRVRNVVTVGSGGPA